MNGQVEEVYSGHSIIKAFNKEENVIDEFDATNDKLYDSAWKSQFFSGMMMPDHAVYRKSWLCSRCDSGRISDDQEND